MKNYQNKLINFIFLLFRFYKMVVITRAIDLLYIETCIENFESSRSKKVSTTYTPFDKSFGTCPSVILFHPLIDDDTRLSCAKSSCLGQETIQFTQKWTSEKSGKNSPRLIYSPHRNSLLVSTRYICSKCGQKYKAHDERFLDQLPPKSIQPFHLFFKSGLTQEGLSLILDSAACGMQFSKIKDLFYKSYQRTWCQWNPWYLILKNQ